MVQSFTDDFRVVWQDPADAQLHWSWDKMHTPRPLAPLGIDVATRVNEYVFKARIVVLNGYPYTHGFAIPMPPAEVFQRGVLQVWENEYAPRIADFCLRTRSADYGSMTAVELADSLGEIIKQAGEAMNLTMIVAVAFGMPTNQLADFCEAELGSDGQQLAATVLQGFDNVSAGAGGELGELATVAAGLPEVAAALREGIYDGLDALPGGPEFLARLREYLDEYGWRADSWGRIHIPTWAETPRTPLMLIGRYLSDGKMSPEAAMKRSVLLREDASREVQSRLSPDKLKEFQKLLGACRNHVRISEGRAFWQLTIDGSLRVPFLALGSKLADAGALDEPGDVVYLRLSETEEAARNPLPSWKDTAGARKEELKRWEGLSPPLHVGSDAPPPRPPDFQRAFDRFWGGKPEDSAEASLIKGHAASKGVITGRARVIMSLAEADRLQKGEILVCPSTAPPWTPLFAVAGGIVTDTGGILSHSAICAREYGIPCVVGTQVATQRIPDGASITVDGSAGTVRIAG